MAGRDPLSRGQELLATGNWVAARQAFADAVSEGGSADALDGLGRALWWLKDVDEAIATRRLAYAAYKREGRLSEATKVAVWLAQELRTLDRNEAAADGWLGRATALASRTIDTSARGWVSLARAEALPEAVDAIAAGRLALEEARTYNDADLEIVSLARLGVLQVATGAVEVGIGRLDEAMAAVSAGEALDLQSVAVAYCALTDVAELIGDSARLAQWGPAIAEIRAAPAFGQLDRVAPSVAYGNLSAFCGACCGGMYLVTGRLDDAEAELTAAIAELEAAGVDSRCVHPVTQLAELRVLQGRLEEARALLQRYEDLPEAVRPLATLDLAAGAPSNAAARLTQRLDQLGKLPVAAFPLWTVLVDAELGLGDLDAAERAAVRLSRVARMTKSRRHRAEALFATGKVAAARQRAPAVPMLRQAAQLFSEAAMALQACRARMLIARCLLEPDQALAISEARAALAAFDRLGAVSDADEAAAFLRDLGVKGRTGPKDLERLTRRETEVLRLVAQGLSNTEIAERLFISTKTAGHHVGNILTKLTLRSRTEAAAFAAIHLPAEPAAR